MNSALQGSQAHQTPLVSATDEHRRAVIVFGDEEHANQALQVFHELERNEHLTLHAEAVIVKDVKGGIRVRRSASPGPQTTVLGFLLGGLIGAHAGPFGLLVGTCAGGLLGAAVDLSWVGIGDEPIAEAIELLVPGEVAVVAELTAKGSIPIDAALETLHGRVERSTPLLSRRKPANVGSTVVAGRSTENRVNLAKITGTASQLRLIVVGELDLDDAEQLIKRMADRRVRNGRVRRGRTPNQSIAEGARQ